jgi:hypothetical protein
MIIYIDMVIFHRTYPVLPLELGAPFIHNTSTQWEIFRIQQMEVRFYVPYFWPYFVGISPDIGLKNRPYIW